MVFMAVLRSNHFWPAPAPDGQGSGADSGSYHLDRLQLQAKRGGSMQLWLRQWCGAGAAGAFTFIAVPEPEQIVLQV